MNGNNNNNAATSNPRLYFPPNADRQSRANERVSFTYAEHGPTAEEFKQFRDVFDTDQSEELNIGNVTESLGKVAVVKFDNADGSQHDLNGLTFVKGTMVRPRRRVFNKPTSVHQISNIWWRKTPESVGENGQMWIETTELAQVTIRNSRTVRSFYAFDPDSPITYMSVKDIVREVIPLETPYQFDRQQIQGRQEKVLLNQQIRGANDLDAISRIDIEYSPQRLRQQQMERCNRYLLSLADELSGLEISTDQKDVEINRLKAQIARLRDELNGQYVDEINDILQQAVNGSNSNEASDEKVDASGDGGDDLNINDVDGGDYKNENDGDAGDGGDDGDFHSANDADFDDQADSDWGDDAEYDDQGANLNDFDDETDANHNRKRSLETEENQQQENEPPLKKHRPNGEM